MITIKYNDKIYTWNIEDKDFVIPDTTVGELSRLAAELVEIKFTINLMIHQALKKEQK